MTVLASNKKAFFDYEIVDTYEAGIMLDGHEVKSVRGKNVSLKGSYITCNKKNECFLRNASISKYRFATVDDYDPERERKLLLHKKEIERIMRKLEEPGFSVVPLEIFAKGRRLKVKIGVGKGKKKYDKRESLKKKDSDRRVQKALKDFNR